MYRHYEWMPLQETSDEQLSGAAQTVAGIFVIMVPIQLKLVPRLGSLSRFLTVAWSTMGVIVWSGVIVHANLQGELQPMLAFAFVFWIPVVLGALCVGRKPTPSNFALDAAGVERDVRKIHHLVVVSERVSVRLTWAMYVNGPIQATVPLENLMDDDGAWTCAASIASFLKSKPTALRLLNPACAWRQKQHPSSLLCKLELWPGPPRAPLRKDLQKIDGGVEVTTNPLTIEL
eukprot:TRINITY_DN38156_c0_g1_i1.p1 TRINITY_DN38156_c0_g1~~TRINITY_DN38156_c0_g1_i1.p1  ORF type:complete len:232 (-),score=35.75 TRINITY_DN38156_c0_g1_i1:49-744(-)